MLGYQGKVLEVDLSKGSAEVNEVPESWFTEYIGGEGFAAKVLFDRFEELEEEMDPMSEENLLILAVGPLTGTKAPCSGRLCFGFKSPLTGTLGMSNVGGHLAPQIKRAGFDMVIISGKSEKPVYLYVDNEKVELKDAEFIWGKDTEETEKLIREKHPDKKIRIAEIGPAGEKLVKFSSIMVDTHRAAGRGGPGAVMGYKKLKAIVFSGSEKLDVENEEMMAKFAAQARKELNDEEFVREELKPFGTPSFTDSINYLGLLPTRNWQRTTFDVMDKIGHEAYHNTLKVKDWACYGCPIACGRHTEIQEGKYKGDSGGGPEYETIGAFGSKCEIDNLNAIAEANYICNRMGLDTISTGQIIATAMEWFEKGLINEKNTDGIKLEFGNDESMIAMVKNIASRNGFGDILAEGSLKAAEKIGGNALDYVMHVKGMELASCGVRASKGESLSHVISPRGADHLRPYASVIDAFGYREEELHITGDISPLEDDNKEWVKPFMELSQLTNLLGVCLFASITLAVKGSTWTGLYNAVTGLDMSLDDMLKAAERVINLERMFNVSNNFERESDYLPKRLLEEPAPDGPGEGETVDMDIMLDDFYQVMDWDVKTGVPKVHKLKELGIL